MSIVTAIFNPLTEAVSPEQVVSVTPAAKAHFARQLSSDKSAKAVRLSVKQSGCTGWMYVIELVKEPSPNDLRLSLDENLELLVDPKSVAVVSGTVIDFVTEGVNQQLKFNNPRVKDYCGCGESFNLAESNPS